MAVRHPQNNDPTLRELSERIVGAEIGEPPPPRNTRQNVYVPLQQTHIPKLAELDIMNYGRESKVVSLAEVGDATVYIKVIPEGEPPWSEYYATLAVPGIVLVIAVAVGVPAISAVGVPGLGPLVFTVLGGSVVYQRWVQRD